MSQARTDTERLDWLEEQRTGYGKGWTAGRSSLAPHRMRLKETAMQEVAYATPREAIDAAMDDEHRKSKGQ